MRLCKRCIAKCVKGDILEIGDEVVEMKDCDDYDKDKCSNEVAEDDE